jgi:Protein of unknown function (DUF2840)
MNDLTTVELLWLERKIENRIRFGRPIAEKILGRHRRRVTFAPGSVFAFVRWTSPTFGVGLSRIDILRVVAPGEECTAVPYVNPGGESLLRLWGWSKVERLLQLIDAIEALGINPEEVATEYWRYAHNRLSVNEMPRAYTLARHRTRLCGRGAKL